MNKTTTWFWHDYETFGVNPRRDKPAQFAGIRTDTDFNILEDPLVLYCQPVPDLVGQPDASLITGITPQMAAERGEPEPRFIERIQAEMARPGTCTVGYNNLRFDDEVTRHTLWRNFFDPYAREWREGCSRWDIIDMVRLAHALRPEGIEWPRREDGAPSFRLEDLARANVLEQDRAHDALSDVRATIALARLIRQAQPKLFDFVYNHRDKHSAARLLDMETRKPVLHVSQKFPAETGCLSPVMPLARHPVNRNALIVFDLRRDPEPLLELGPDDLYDRVFIPRESLPEDVERVALKSVHLNKCPVLAPFGMMSEREAERLSLDLSLCKQRWQAVFERRAETEAKVTAVFNAWRHEPGDDPETALYDGFVGDRDRRIADRVCGMTADDFSREAVTFEDERLNGLLFLYRARYYPDSLSDKERAHWQEWLCRKLAFAPEGGLNLDQYEERVAVRMRQAGADPERMRVLEDLEAWSRRLRASVGGE